MTLRSAIPLLAGMAFIVVRAIRKSPSIGEKIGIPLGLAVGIAPAVWILTVRGIPSKLVIGYAGIAFIVSVLLKWGIYLGVLSKYVHPRLSPTGSGIVQGSLSAACELGVATLVFAVFFPGLGLWEVAGIGAGAAGVEALMVAAMGNPHAGGPEDAVVSAQILRMRAGPAWLPGLMPVADRTIATVDHIACRGLVAAGVASREAWPFLVAVAVFAATDGWAYYCLRSGWKFGIPQVAARMYGLLAIPAAISAATWALAA